MNAHEAIANMEYKLESLKSKEKNLVRVLTKEDEQAFLEYIDSFAIVLESAKLLHGHDQKSHMETKDITSHIYLDDGGHEEKVVGKEYNVSFMLTREQAKKAGIDEGSDTKY